jgi:YggT family protein
MREFAQILAFLLSLYYLLVIIRILLTWVRVPGGIAPSGPMIDTLGRIVDPYLNFFKRFIPLRFSRLDFSPLLALISISLVQRLLQTYAYTGTMTFGYALALVLRSLWWSAGAYALGLLCVMLAVRLYLCYRPTTGSIQLIAALDTWLDKVLDQVHKTFFNGREISDRTLVTAALVIAIVAFILLSVGVNLLSNVLSNLKF